MAMGPGEAHIWRAPTPGKAGGKEGGKAAHEAGKAALQRERRGPSGAAPQFSGKKGTRRLSHKAVDEKCGPPWGPGE